MKIPFKDVPNTAAIICCHIMEGKAPILYASHDNDGMWQFLCGKTHSTDEARLISLQEAFDYDNSIGALCDMPCGYYAERNTVNDTWIIKKR